MTTRTEAVKAYLLDLQDRICSALETFEADTRFIEDAWTRPAGGGGRTYLAAACHRPPVPTARNSPVVVLKPSVCRW